MSNLLHLNRRLDCVATFRCRSQYLIQSLLAASFLVTDVCVFNCRPIMCLNLRIDLILENLLHRAAKSPLLYEVSHASLTICLSNLQLLMKSLASEGLTRAGICWLLWCILDCHGESLAKVWDGSGLVQRRGLYQARQWLLLIADSALTLMSWHSLLCLVAQQLFLKLNRQVRFSIQWSQSCHCFALFANLWIHISHVIVRRVLLEAHSRCHIILILRILVLTRVLLARIRALSFHEKW